MPLSEHEQRQLEQIEQALYADYPKLAQAVRARDPKIHYKRRVVYAAIGFLLGWYRPARTLFDPLVNFFR